MLTLPLFLRMSLLQARRKMISSFLQLVHAGYLLGGKAGIATGKEGVWRGGVGYGTASMEVAPLERR